MKGEMKMNVNALSRARRPQRLKKAQVESKYKKD